MSPSDEIVRTQNDWYRDAVIYELHVRAFADSNGDGIGDFRGLTDRLDHLRDLGVTAIWLLPFYPSPLRDDGYDIADYYGVNPSYGTLADVKRFLREAHKRGLRVITELVLNHTSDQHPWFQRARTAKPGSRWRDWYVWSDDPTRYADARIIFQDFESSNWAWDPVAGQYYWHRFYSQQPDLNYENPEVQVEMMRVLDFWFDLGVDGLRLDAVPYLFQEEGTNCENLPQTHEYLRQLRKHVESRYPDRMLLAEANQWPEDAAAYFGQGDECHMNFHFPLMPRLFMALQMEDRFPIIDILQQTPQVPEGCQWALFLRNHDELTLEMVTDEERDYMYRVYARDREARINLGIRRRLAPLLEDDRNKVELMNGLLLSMPGTPVIYYGDEIGMGDNVYLGDRDGVRTPMQWNPDRNAGFSGANPQRLYLPVIIDPHHHYEAVNVESQDANPSSLLWWMRRILALRRRYPVFGRGDIEFLHPENPAVIVYLRSDGDDTVLVVANLSRHAQHIELDLSRFRGAHLVELFGQTPFPDVGDGSYALSLGPYGFYWLSVGSAKVPVERVGEIRVPGSDLARVFARDRRNELAAAIRKFLVRQRWYAGKSRRLREVEVVDAIEVPLGEGPAAVVLADALHQSGEPDRYVLPLVVLTGERAAEFERSRPEAIVARLRSGGGAEALLVDALADPVNELPDVLLDVIGRRRRLRGRVGDVRGTPTRAYRALRGAHSDPLPPGPSRGEQSNTSVILGDRLLMKVFRRLPAGRNPDLELGLVLTDQRFPHAAQVAGAVEYGRDGDEPATLAVLHEYVSNEGDLWAHAVRELGLVLERALSGEEQVTSRCDIGPVALVAAAMADEVDGGAARFPARLLGERLAELHLALSSPRAGAAFAPEPFTKLYQRSLYQTLRNRTQQTMQALRRARLNLDDQAGELADQIFEHEDRVSQLLLSVTERPVDANRIRTHGDLHLGQVLWTGRDVIFIDFEGEPLRAVGERRIKRSPFRDVAGLVRSFDYATHVARAELATRGVEVGERWHAVDEAQRCWYQAATSDLLRGYLGRAEGTHLLPDEPGDVPVLLGAFLVEKSLYEVTYELETRPAWLHVPLRGLAALAGIEVDVHT
jgi:maltose alpha-D-glucosyltransferase / alpha-amylase